MDRQNEDLPIIREPMIEGIFYPADQGELRQAIQLFLSSSPIIPTSVRLIVSPHGSFEFSGHIMAAAFKAAAGVEPERVIIVSSCFHEHETAVFLPESHVFRTPLGDSFVDQEFLGVMMDASTIIQKNDLPHLQEHTIEIQLPFIQYLFPRALIAPVLMGQASEVVLKSLISGLTLAMAEDNKQTLIIISANLTGVLNQERAPRDGERILEYLCRGQVNNILNLHASGEISGENAGPLALAAFFARNGSTNVLAQDSSLSVNSDPVNVVQYAAISL